MRLERRWAAFVAAAAVAGAASTAGAQQFDLTFSGSGETAGDEVHVLFSELGLIGAGLGLRPVASLGGFLVFSDGSSSWGVTPAAGLRYRTSAGFLQGKIGWAFRDSDATPFFGGRDNGLHTSAHAEFWGSAYNAQGIVAYNWGGDYLWSRARVGRRLGTLSGGGSWGLGAELIYQAETEGAAPGFEGFRSTQLGPVVQWAPRAAGASFALSGGLKRTEFDVTTAQRGSNDTWYLRAEVYLP
jgi:hypothetical protein